MEIKLANLQDLRASVLSSWVGKSAGLAGSRVLAADVPVALAVALSGAEGSLGVGAGLALVELEADGSLAEGGDEPGCGRWLRVYGLPGVGLGFPAYLGLVLGRLGAGIGPGVAARVVVSSGLEVPSVAAAAPATAASAADVPVVVGVLVVGVGDEHLGLQQVGQRHRGGGVV